MSTREHRYFGAYLRIKGYDGRINKWELIDLAQERLSFYGKNDGTIVEEDILIVIPNIDGDFSFDIEEKNEGFEVIEIDFNQIQRFLDNFSQEFHKEMELLEKYCYNNSIQLQAGLIGWYS